MPRRKRGFDSRWALWRPCPTSGAYKLRAMVAQQPLKLSVWVRFPQFTRRFCDLHGRLFGMWESGKSAWLGARKPPVRARPSRLHRRASSSAAEQVFVKHQDVGSIPTLPSGKKSRHNPCPRAYVEVKGRMEQNEQHRLGPPAQRPEAARRTKAKKGPEPQERQAV